MDDYTLNNDENNSQTTHERKYSDLNPPTTITSNKEMDISPVENNSIAKD